MKAAFVSISNTEVTVWTGVYFFPLWNLHKIPCHTLIHWRRENFPSKWQANCWPLTNPRPERSAIYVLVVCTWWRGSPYWKASPNECGAPVKWWRTKRLHTKIIRTILDSITIDYGKQRETTGSVLGVGAVNFRLWDGHSDSRRHRMLSWTGLQLYTNTTTILLTTGV